MVEDNYDIHEKPGLALQTPVAGLRVVPAGLHHHKIRTGDLRSVDLSGVDLAGVDLSGADMCWAQLVGADLRQARLVAVRLEGARYDATTLWPEGFDPEYFGAIRLD